MESELKKLAEEIVDQMKLKNLTFNSDHECAPSNFEEGISLAIEHAENYHKDEIEKDGIESYVSNLIEAGLQEKYLIIKTING